MSKKFIEEVGSPVKCIVCLFSFVVISCARNDVPKSLSALPLIPKPQEIVESGGTFSILPKMHVHFEQDSVGDLVNIIKKDCRKATMFEIGRTNTKKEAEIIFSIDTNTKWHSDEAYRLQIKKNNIHLSAKTKQGLFRSWQTLYQILNFSRLNAQDSEEFSIPTGIILDYPYYSYRGVMLDVARHFFSVEEVKDYIEKMALYKINYLHLHLSDDQGWRIEINGWPNLTQKGGMTEVGERNKGGFYTQKDYRELVDYAHKRFIVVVPEIDMPGHTNAALFSYPELNCDNQPRKPYIGIGVGFSSLCIGKKVVYRFVDDVIREISKLTPGKYFHIGGDEAEATNEDDYKIFISKVTSIVSKYGKTTLGWDEIAHADLPQNTVAQFWNNKQNALMAKEKGHKLLMSPASYAYLDMKYDSLTPLGLSWAGYINLKTAYDWNPEDLLADVEKEDIIGIESPLWTETVTNSDDLEYMPFPRLIGHAEIGWTKPENRSWIEYKERLMEHQSLLDFFGVNYYSTSED